MIQHFPLGPFTSKLNPPGSHTACSKLPLLSSSCGKTLYDAYFTAFKQHFSFYTRVIGQIQKYYATMLELRTVFLMDTSAYAQSVFLQRNGL